MTWSMTLSNKPRLHLPVDSGRRWHTVYGVGSPFQLSPTRAAAVVNRRIFGPAVVDFEDGSDLLVFDDLAGLDPAQAIPLARTEDAVHPRTGQKLHMVCYLMMGGFVPLEARLEDGSLHPAAGTGFAMATMIGYPAEFLSRLHPTGDVHSLHELLQLRYDGRTFEITDRRRFRGPDLVPGFTILNYGLNVAIPDGPDLLSGLVAGPMVRENEANGFCIPTAHPGSHRILGRNYGCAFCRWVHEANAWHPSAIVPVSGPDLSGEPSLVRDMDGSLLMAVRGKGLKEPPGAVHDGLENTYEHFRVLRSTDSGATWASVLHKPRMRNATPVVLNRSAGGHPYLAANPYQAGTDRQGRVIPSTHWRNKLCLWPLTADRRDVEPPVCALDADAAFGPPQPLQGEFAGDDNIWMVDHPVATVCRLGDRRWRCIQSFRVSDRGVNAAGAAPTKWNGAWFEQVRVEGEREIPAWRF